MEKLLKKESKLSLTMRDNSIEFFCDEKLFVIKSVRLISEKFDPHVSSFKGIVNDESCSFIVNCGHTPPTIKFNFPEAENTVLINHSVQEEILKKLNKLNNLFG